MPACEKCWGDAFVLSKTSGKSQPDCYKELLTFREDNPCSPEDQAGQFWDEEKQKDRRTIK